ncbi:MAG: 6,7-dimethyl-8-ribityllumazine synthase [Planctomycetaceae bacterium]
MRSQAELGNELSHIQKLDFVDFAIMVETQGSSSGSGERFGIVVSRFNDEVTQRLLDGALETFHERGIGEDRITVVWVPGAFEIPLVAQRLAKSGKFAAVCCLGAVIRGETTHDQYINQQVSRAIMDIGLSSGIPVLFGVLTCQNTELAMERAGGSMGNKGSETAQAAIEMVKLLKGLS